jgi:hypothetical protein
MPIHLNNRAAGLNFKPMTIRTPHGIAARPVRTAAKAVVAMIAEPDRPLMATSEELRRWRALTPFASWSTVSVRDASPDEILRGVAAELARHDAEAHRLILLAEGKAARIALELVLQGALGCAGILAIAPPCSALPFRIVPTAAAVRLVVRREEQQDAPNNLITALRAADVDARIISLDPAAASAAEPFFLELVANVSRQAPHQSRYGV